MRLIQFDWNHEVVLLCGVTVIVKVAHVRLCHSRMLFVRAYPRETQEMVFDAHDRAFASAGPLEQRVVGSIPGTLFGGLFVLFAPNIAEEAWPRQFTALS